MDKQSSGMPALALLLVASSFLVDAPLRYALSLIGLDQLLYSRDLIGAYFLSAAVFSWIVGRGGDFRIVVFCYLMALHFFIGAWILPSILQPLVGAKVCLSLAFGVCVAASASAYSRFFGLWAVVGLLIVLLGVFVNSTMPYPWEGSMISSALGDRALTLEWSAGGIKRLAGLSRASFDAAATVLILIVPCVMVLRGRWWWQILIVCASMYGIWLTTSKGALLALSLFCLWYVLKYSFRWRVLASACVYMLLFVVIFMPIAGVLIDYAPRIADDEAAWWLSSFIIRLQQMWPSAFANVMDHGSIVLGRGLGGVGFPQLFGEPGRYNSADNVFVYLYSSFGILSIAYLTFITNAASRLSQTENGPLVDQCAAGWVVVWLAYGLTTNMIEQPFASMAIGLVVGRGLVGLGATRTKLGSRSEFAR